MRGYLSLFLALSTIGCVKVTETVIVYADATTPDAQEPTDAGFADIGVTADSGLSDAGDTDASPLDSGPSDSGAADAGFKDDCQLALGVPCTVFEEGYLKASNTEARDYFGWSVALSGDGNTLAVCAYHESSDAVGVDGNQADNSATESGAVYVFIRSGAIWSQQAYVKASNTGANDNFGRSVALSGDGNTLAVGAYGESSDAVGVDGNQVDNSARQSGAVYVFTRSGTTWTQRAYVKASNTNLNDYFGYSVALDGDGDTLAVGAWGEDSNATGVNGNQADDSAENSGAVYLFTRNGATWNQQAYIKASNSNTGDFFGESVALSNDGDVLAAGAYREGSNARGVNGNQNDNSAQDSGAVYLFSRNGTMWTQQAYIKASNTAINDYFGESVALSNDGDTLAVGARYEDSNATGVDGNQADNSAQDSGAVYVFTRSGATWTQQAYIKASDAGADDQFGVSVALSRDGSSLAVGAYAEDSNATGVNGDQADNAAGASGAVYIFRRNGTIWTQRAYLKASNTGAGDNFGQSVALSGDGGNVTVGAWSEDSIATGVNGNQADNSALESGAVYVRRIAP